MGLATGVGRRQAIAAAVAVVVAGLRASIGPMRRAAIAVKSLWSRLVRASYFRFRRSERFWPIFEFLTNAGERWHIEWLTYNPLVFAFYHEEAVASAPGVMRTFARLFPNAHRYVDVGAGSGAFAVAAQRLGRPTVAYEHGWFGRLLARKRGIDVRPLDLDRRAAHHADCRFELAYCFEVAEHLDAPLGDQLVRFCATLAPLVVFTAAPPGQGGTGHKNEQPGGYWIDRFNGCGMRYDDPLTREVADGFRAEDVRSTWLADNVMVFAAYDADSETDVHPPG